MDDLDRLFRHLARSLAARDPSLLRRSFPLLEIPQRLFPYAAARRTAGFESHQDYEMAILRLASGERDYAKITPEEVADALTAETASPTPDTTLFRRFPEAQIQLLEKAVREILGDEVRFAPDVPEGAGPLVVASSRGGPEVCARCGLDLHAAWHYCPDCGAVAASELRRYRVAVLPGDGIGPEVIEAALPVLDAAAACHGFSCVWESLPYSAEHYLQTGETLPMTAFRRLRDAVDAILVGAFGDPRVPGDEHARDILLGLRIRLDLYVNFRPIKLYHPDLTPLRGEPHIDLALFRENTEGAYLGRGRVDGETHVAEEVHTESGVERIIRAAFEWAEAHERRRVTMADKSNAIPAHRVWQVAFQRLAAEFPAIEAEHRYIDALTLELARDPQQFDVIVTTNLFGDIVSDLAAALVGGIGLAASANLHPGHVGLFEPVHGSAPTLAGKGIANPLATILAGALMFEALGELEAAAAVEVAVRRALAGGLRTADLGGRLSTSDASRMVFDAIA